MAVPAGYWTAVLDTPIGRLGLRVEGEAVVAVAPCHPSMPPVSPGDPVSRRAAAEIERYFRDPTYPFTVPVAAAGTVFQRRVWAALTQIPAGEARSYGRLARVLGSGPRAVGGACRANPVPLLIPCHRVVAAGGLGGYSGATSGALLDIKRYLLLHEAGGYHAGAAGPVHDAGVES